jgi:lipopolysaccharide transport system ATP-binding protein
MLSNPAISAESVGKRYRIGGKEVRPDTMAAAIAGWIKSPAANYRQLRALSRFDNAGNEENVFWALQNVSFEVARGEVVGVIGRNGAGKSTLLKILSRITHPTTGKVKIRGRVASLLEVGTGFHPDLTGRENVYLNGTLLGMSRAEVTRRFDEIVDFSGVEKFIDTPVKRYSSGMQVRLAFAVAAHLEPEILLIDEVLAVGDLGFQRKAMRRMAEVSLKRDITVLCVSHNMAAVMNLCPRSILLSDGRVKFFGDTGVCVDMYRREFMEIAMTSLDNRTDRVGDGSIRFVDTWVENDNGQRGVTIPSGDSLRLVAEFQARDDIRSLQIAFAVYTADGIQIADLWSKSVGCEWDDVPSAGRVTCTIPRVPLNAGEYRFNVFARVGNVTADGVESAGNFEIAEADFFGSGILPARNQGSVLLDQSWNLE